MCAETGGPAGARKEGKRKEKEKKRN